MSDFGFRGTSAANKLRNFHDHGPGSGPAGTTRTKRAHADPVRRRRRLESAQATASVEEAAAARLTVTDGNIIAGRLGGDAQIRRLGGVLCILGRHAEAEASLREAARLNPADAWAYGLAAPSGRAPGLLGA